MKKHFLRMTAGLYVASLVLYPREFRRRYGADMADVFRRELEDAMAVAPASVFPILMDSVRDALSIALPDLAANPLVLAAIASMALTSMLYLGLVWALANPLQLNSIYHTFVRICSP